MKRFLTTGVACLALASAAQAQDAPADAPQPMDQPRDWSATLVQDATALHDIMVDSHPGTHDPLNPEFRARLDQGLAAALERAKTTTDVGGWWWALRAYVASFQDGHVQIGMTQRDFGFPTRWPGFLTVYRGADQVVASRNEADADAPPLGAQLIDCDGVDAATLAEQRIGQFRGRWFLEAIRTRLGDWMFLSAENPWQTEMKACRFETDGATMTYALDWRAAPDDLSDRRARLMQSARPDFALKHFDDGGFWISTPTFNGDPSSENYAELTALIADMKATLADLPHLYTGKPVERFATAIEAVEDATLWLLDQKTNPDAAADVLAAADAYLKLLGDVVGGWMLAKGALAAKAKLDANDGDRVWLQGKLDLYEVYAANVLGHVSSRLAAVGQGGDLLRRISADVLAG